MSDRETLDRFFGYPEPQPVEEEPDLDGDFVVLVLPEDEEERVISTETSLRLALHLRDAARRGFRAIGFTHRVEVRDVDDPDKRLDWGLIGEDT